MGFNISRLVIKNNYNKNLEELAEDVKLNLHILRISKSLERIADHITHISEDIIYIMEAQSIRHQ